MTIELHYGGIQTGTYNPHDPRCQDCLELARQAHFRPMRMWCDDSPGVYVLSPADFRTLHDAYIELLELQSAQPLTGSEASLTSSRDARRSDAWPDADAKRV